MFNAWLMLVGLSVQGCEQSFKSNRKWSIAYIVLVLLLYNYDLCTRYTQDQSSLNPSIDGG